MRSPITEHRLELVTALRNARADLFRLEQSKLRFNLGVSAADLKIPFHVSTEIERIVTFAARQLMWMLAVRHRALLPKDAAESLALTPDTGHLPNIPDGLSTPVGNSDVRATADLAVGAHPLLTGGLISAWLGPGGGGRSLVALVTEQLRKAVLEMQACRGQEETPSLVALMLSSTFPAAEAAIRQVSFGLPLDRALRGAAGTGMYLAVRLGAERAFRDVQVASETVLRSEIALGPTVLMGGRPGLSTNGSTMYGCDLSGGIPSFDAFLGQLSLSTEGPQAVETSLFRMLSDDAELGRRAEHAIAHAQYREWLIRLCLMGEQGALPRELTHAIRDLLLEPGGLGRVLDDAKVRKEMAKDVLASAARNAEAGALLTRFADAIRKHGPRDPLGPIGLSRTRAHGEYARAATACLCDFWVEKQLYPTRRALVARTGAESEGGLEREYEAGQLYVLSLQDAPVLKTTVQPPLAHLFVDVKDFTRRTTLLGQAAMADFLRREFYLPILMSAKRHFGGARHLADRGGLTLNNLLGDAASMSGTIEAAVALAADIRRHLAAFEQRLTREISSETVEKAVQAIEAEFARKASAPGADAAKLAAEKRDALARARGEGLEAGVFVSFGDAPLVITIEDDVFGRSKVAIADKINESARGTARANGARARIDALLEAERVRRGDPNLQHAWSVFVGAPIAFTLPAELEEPIRSVVRAGNWDTAMNLLQKQMRGWLEEAAHVQAAGVGDVYNAGAALSEEALVAYQEALGTRRLFQKLELIPDGLEEEIRRRFFFAPGLLKLQVAFHPDGRIAEIFRFAGRAMFKGLEKSGGIGVWELVTEGPLFDLFARHHAKSWFRGTW